ncbi:uncharacterized protein BCR38DRAFT_452417 [Pseudomassariella vexata]|uniref:Uncharacterized protein n=1 Tax=Pseudomassariella vexata TaxID=1141098 RepID=A0A1Y2D9Z2_9PEZI|nr:uncharacterized protein BCR38DRAFT_452417 [Pseudomassariella vexata]ORY55485.1 hypothetical protein BCR38DRAFT_452417 [Pseudomassariella vexata]
MATASHAPKPFEALYVSQADLEAFHNTHFSAAAAQFFSTNFLQSLPTDERYHDETLYEVYEEEEQEDDGLGYYPDGVKRTLTDEQIAIFRHSELEALRREESKAAKGIDCSKAPKGSEDDGTPHKLESVRLAEADYTYGSESEEGQLDSDTPKPKRSSTSSKKKKKRKKPKHKVQNQKPQRGDAGWFKQTIKPDLRKRTWDVVESGMDSLDYDDEAGTRSVTGSAAQRRKISYDD